MKIRNLIFTKLHLSLLPFWCHIAEGFSVSTRSSVPSETATSSTYTISFPNVSKNTSYTGDSSNSKKDLFLWFNDLIDSTPYFERCPNHDKDDEKVTFTVPSMDNAKISLFEDVNDGKVDNDLIHSDECRCSCTIEIENISENDYGTICAKLYESQGAYQCRYGGTTLQESNGELRQVVKKHFSAQRPHTGYDAQLSKTEKVQSIVFQGGKNDVGDTHINQKDELLCVLKEKGFVTIDTKLMTSVESSDKLSAFLQKKTKQDSSIRSDTVAFLDRDDAQVCGLSEQFEVLLGMANFLNENFSFDYTGYEPLPPASKDRPLTNPRNIQAAEYGEGEFYVAHSDNLLANSNARSNYRLYTCILYCNDDWDAQKDGGALRIYPNTAHLLDPAEAVKNQLEYEDINPSNGKLLIFDSRLVHSVERIQSTTKKRLALTLWMMRPEDCGVAVNIWDEEKGQVDWYRLF